MNDSIIAKDLFFDEVEAFRQLEESLQHIYFLLLGDKREFISFFNYLEYKAGETNIEGLIKQRFNNAICSEAELNKFISESPVELAYCIALINTYMQQGKSDSVTPPWVLKNYPQVEQIMIRLRNKPCLKGCDYCRNKLNIYKGLKKFFGYSEFRTFGGQPLQEKAVEAAVNGKSLLAVFPTGGGKSLTFQVPALMSGEICNGLTVVISPLQSLMKDQVDNLERVGITQAVTINGLLDPIERAKSFERVEDGSATILYLSPEALQSKSIEQLILGRKIIRFVIDEAHCFSAWGRDFRVDYLYIGDFIKNIQQKKNLKESLPVSCFTATAKQRVIEDIRDYFNQKPSLELELYNSKATRTNLHYKVLEKNNEQEKYQTLKNLIEENECPVIIYVSRTSKAFNLAERLTKDGFNAKPYHGKMDAKQKTENQNDFISGKVRIMVATSAFGMGVDKKDVGMVVHYEISDSLENYIQEAGRAGRDEKIEADCYVLFNEEDLSKHFILLNQTKLSLKEIQQIWQAIKELTKFRSKISNSALEIARKAGWDDSVTEIETRVKTAIAALEDAGYLKRGQNIPKIFATGILVNNVQEAIDKINASHSIDEKEKAIRIIKKLISSKYRKLNDSDEGESRIDYLSDHLGIVKEEVIRIINLLIEEKILADTKDLSAYIRKGENKNRAIQILDTFSEIESFLLPFFEEIEKTVHIKELNESAESYGCEDVNPNKINIILNYWAVKNWIKRQYPEYSKNHITVVCNQPQSLLQHKMEKRHEIAAFVVQYLYQKSSLNRDNNNTEKDELVVEFSVYELKTAFENSIASFGKKASMEDIEDSLFYLSRIGSIRIDGGFLVVYNTLTIERTEHDNFKRYTKEDYTKLNEFYENKVQQIHIVGEYAKKMIEDYKAALQFVEDYFQLNYSSFLRKYFPGSKATELKLRITPTKFRQLFGELSPVQLKIINDSESRIIIVAAAPGSGKTKVLVHKLASLLLMEDVKHEQLLMLTFSRAAATEFKKRLIKLIGNAANYVEIKTFHSYCFDLLGKVGNLEKSELILKKTVEKIKNKEVESSKITKAVLVIDEAQDMDENEFGLINTLIEHNQEMRVIAVGDDDQNIFGFRGSSSRYMEQWSLSTEAKTYELIENFRSKNNLVEFTNQFVKTIKHRLKETPIISRQTDNGKIKLVRHHSPNLITPLAQDIISTDLSGTTCVLVKTNEEAWEITGLLTKYKLNTRLIQSNESFDLSNISELRFFLNSLNLAHDTHIINEEYWEKSKRELIKKFQRSSKLELCLNTIDDFELANPAKKYKSDLESFIRESRLEDFFRFNRETIYVSTIHKAKGKEFDNIFLMLNNYNINTDDSKRLLYVAMSRAKENLTIHLNSGFLDNLQAENFEKINDTHTYLPPQGITMQLSHKDVWLDYFINRQNIVSALNSGDPLQIGDFECLDQNGQSVIKFSQQFISRIEAVKRKHYFLKGANVNFILYWKKEGSDTEYKIILPELYFERYETS